MESNIYMSQNPRKNKTGLLPNYFKKIGIVVMILTFIPAVIVKAMDISMMQAQKELFKLMTMNMFILGLLFIVWAKDKVEDEMTIALRLKSMGVAFIWAVLYVVLKPLIDVLFKDPIADFKAQELVLSMLLVYLILYYIQKKGR
jgi:hypothetical protein